MTNAPRRRMARSAAGAGLLAPALVIIAAAFLAPLARLFALSLTSTAGLFGAYRELATEDVYWIVVKNTVLLAVVVTLVTLSIGFALAMTLTRLSGGWRLGLFACIILPLWISVLVRTFSWMLLLEGNGPINRFLVATGATNQPVPFLFNFSGVMIGMVHVLLPYAVLPIYAALIKIDPALLQASDGLGASPMTTFGRIVLPLSVRGLATAATFTFLLSLGFFITPALLGGPSNTTIPMLIDSFVNERLAWPLAAAASMVLLAMVLGLVGVVARLVPLGSLAEAK